jgi:hypothetical protein
VLAVVVVAVTSGVLAVVAVVAWVGKHQLQ